nr:hypothetical protein [Tanacetum cinerariifolium]
MMDMYSKVYGSHGDQERESSSIIDFCLFGFYFQSPPALPSLSDSTSILREDALCYDVFQKQIMFLVNENTGYSFRCLCSYFGISDALNSLSMRIYSPLSSSLWKTPFSSLLNTIFLSGSLFLGDSEWPCLGLGLPDMLRACLDPSLFLRFFLLLGVPDSECYSGRMAECENCSPQQPPQAQS